MLFHLCTPPPHFIWHVQAFTEHQVKMVETNQRVRVSEAQIQSLRHSIARAQLTDKEIASLPDGTNMYKAVGRMCVPPIIACTC